VQQQPNVGIADAGSAPAASGAPACTVYSRMWFFAAAIGCSAFSLVCAAKRRVPGRPRRLTRCGLQRRCSTLMRRLGVIAIGSRASRESAAFASRAASFIESRPGDYHHAAPLDRQWRALSAHGSGLVGPLASDGRAASASLVFRLRSEPRDQRSRPAICGRRYRTSVAPKVASLPHALLILRTSHSMILEARRILIHSTQG
jgi:hypothetical protein